MDKQKQIEEMAKILDEDCGDCHKCNYYDNEDSGGIECIFWLYAERIYNAGYRKIPENAVVLTGTKAEEHFVDLLTEFDEMGFYHLTTCANAEEYTKYWKRRMLYAIGQLRKETAEKFARLVEFHSVSTRDNDGREIFTISALGLKEILHEEFDIPYDEICKEITEGKV